RRYFEREHADARPCTAHMFATGEVIGSHPVIDELVREARAWLARPIESTEAALVRRRYGAVDLLDDARDVVDRDPAGAALLLAEAVRDIVAYAFWRRGVFQPRRKDALSELAKIDAAAAALVGTWSTSTGHAALETALALARHVLGVDTFF